MKRRTVIGIGLLVVIALGGCVEFESTMELNEDGEIVSAEIHMEFSDEAWEMIEMAAHVGEYPSIEAFVLADDEEFIDDDEHVTCAPGAEYADVDERAQTITISCDEIILDEAADINIEVTEESIAYRDQVLAEDQQQEWEDNPFVEDMEGFSMEVTLIMPDEIIATNAHSVDGTAATWDLTSFQDDEVYVESANPSYSPPADDPTDTVSDDVDVTDDVDVDAGDVDAPTDTVDDVTDVEVGDEGDDETVLEEGSDDDDRDDEDDDDNGGVADSSTINASVALVALLLIGYYIMRRT